MMSMHRSFRGIARAWRQGMLGLLLAGAARADVPVATCMQPDNAAVGYATFTALVYGVNFEEDVTQARLGGTDLEVQYLDATSLSVVVTAGFTEGPRNLELSNDGTDWSTSVGALMIYSSVTMNGAYYGLYNYTNSYVTANNVTVSSYNGSTNTGTLEVRAWRLRVASSVDAKGRGYGGGGGGGG
ncbi:MAG: hypothetical protein KA248_03245, partial [Kiritimatiellae bacterium]|nr:hypothetical protein [Kiritimatiellia bacterium]